MIVCCTVQFNTVCMIKFCTSDIEHLRLKEEPERRTCQLSVSLLSLGNKFWFHNSVNCKWILLELNRRIHRVELQHKHISSLYSPGVGNTRFQVRNHQKYVLKIHLLVQSETTIIGTSFYFLLLLIKYDVIFFRLFPNCYRVTSHSELTG